MTTPPNIIHYEIKHPDEKPKSMTPIKLIMENPNKTVSKGPTAIYTSTSTTVTPKSQSSNENGISTPTEPSTSQPPSPVFYKNNLGVYLNSKMLADISTFQRSSGKKTGFKNLDKIIGSLYPGLYILGAGSSIGKTTLLLQIGDQLAAEFEHVLYFTLEQSSVELVTKSLSRRTALACRKNPTLAVSAIDIRKGIFSQVVKDEYQNYLSEAPYMTIIQGDFQTDMNEIESTVADYVATTGVVPVIMVDYLQIIKEDSQFSDKAKVDVITKRLKLLQRKYNAVLIAISSINRCNYMLPIDFESFKESGSIEYSADVVWGLQLQILNDPAFIAAKKVDVRRKLIANAKAASPRKVELVCLKNRYGIASFSCGFNYYPQFDLFTQDLNYQTLIPLCIFPNIII